ncbi:MAG TPA: hypothetical protein VGI45_14945 [Terracidiphilus sp.]|jgi:uncharacterized protein YjgD (DUF1641 family)
MARAIGLEGMPRNARDDLRRKLERAPEEHAEALLESYELLQQLHDSGALSLLRGVLRSGDLLLDTAVNAAKSDEAIRGLRNAIILAKMLGSINPDLLQSYANAVSETLGCQKPVVEPPGLFKLLAEFRHPELRRSMALINKFLESFGNQLKTRGDCH